MTPLSLIFRSALPRTVTACKTDLKDCKVVMRGGAAEGQWGRKEPVFKHLHLNHLICPNHAQPIDCSRPFIVYAAITTSTAVLLATFTAAAAIPPPLARKTSPARLRSMSILQETYITSVDILWLQLNFSPFITDFNCSNGSMNDAWTIYINWNKPMKEKRILDQLIL